MSKISLSLQRTNIIKGLAILAVVGIHISSYYHGIYEGPWHLLYTSLDQLWRFCVPAFILLSGYGLAYKYENSPLHYLDFFKSRLGKLLPLYLLWSASSLVIIGLMSSDGSIVDYQVSDLLKMLAYGTADYQLYFLSVLFQLYLLFPVLWLFRKRIGYLLILACGVQMWRYFNFTYHPSTGDYSEYISAWSWIAYFVLGIYLKLQDLPEKLTKLIPLAPYASLLAFIALVASTTKQLGNHTDPLVALKFTRLIVMPFVILFNLSLISIRLPLRSSIQNASTRAYTMLTGALAWLGQNSFVIFLSHTIALRIIYGLLRSQMDLTTIIGATVLWLLSVYLGQKL